jgi:Fe2+ or Zn2+ uptake regulation protein
MDTLTLENHRQTKVRKALLKIFAQDNKPFSVPEILAFLQKENLTPNKTTIYRELEFLIEKDIIHEVRLGDRKTRYETTAQDHHHHLICIKCKKIEDVLLTIDVDSEEKRIEKEKKFKVLHHSLEFFGVCKQCLR